MMLWNNLDNLLWVIIYGMWWAGFVIVTCLFLPRDTYHALAARFGFGWLPYPVVVGGIGLLLLGIVLNIIQVECVRSRGEP